MAETVRKPKPIAGALWGVPLGLGLALLAINAKIISLSIVSILLVTLVGIVLGVLWGMFGPAKKAEGPAPSTATAPAPDPITRPAPGTPDPAVGDTGPAPPAPGAPDPTAGP